MELEVKTEKIYILKLSEYEKNSLKLVVGSLELAKCNDDMKAFIENLFPMIKD